MAGLRWEFITTVGILMLTPVEYGATLQTLARNGTTVLYRPVSSWKMLDVRRRTYG